MSRCQQHLALLYSYQGRYIEVESLLQQILVFREHTLGEEHIDTSETLNDLGVLYWRQGLYARAEPLLQRALTIWEHQGKRGPEMATILNNLGVILPLSRQCF